MAIKASNKAGETIIYQSPSECLGRAVIFWGIASAMAVPWMPGIEFYRGEFAFALLVSSGISMFFALRELCLAAGLGKRLVLKQDGFFVRSPFGSVWFNWHDIAAFDQMNLFGGVDRSNGSVVFRLNNGQVQQLTFITQFLRDVDAIVLPSAGERAVEVCRMMEFKRQAALSTAPISAALPRASTAGFGRKRSRA